MTVSRPTRRTRLWALVVGAFAAVFLALAAASRGQDTRADDKVRSPATPLPANEDPTLRKVVEQLARQRYLFVKRLHETRGVTLYQQTFYAAYALFPVGRDDRVYILSDDLDSTNVSAHIYRYDRKDGRDRLVYAVRLEQRWNPDKPWIGGYTGRIKSLLQVVKQNHWVPVGKISRFARDDLSREQEIVRYTWIPYTDTVNIRLSSRLNDSGPGSITSSDADTNATRQTSTLLSGNLVKKNGLPICREEFAIIKARYSKQRFP